MGERVGRGGAAAGYGPRQEWRHSPSELLQELKSRAPRTPGGKSGDLAGRKLKEIEHQAIVATLKLTGGNKAETAKRLGISRRALYDKIEKYGIK